MSWRSLFTTPASNGLDLVETQLVDMLRLDRHSLGLAHRALFDGGDPEQLKREASDTDHQVNLLVQELRRELVVHAAVQPSAADVPAMLTYMSIAKDIERIGDYAKNILDIARARQAPTDDALDDLVPQRGLVETLIAEVIVVLEQHDQERAAEMIDRTAPTLHELDTMVDRLTASDQPGHHAVPRALYLRHVKRIAAHLLNVLSSLIAPLDQLDFYGTAPDDQ